MKTSTFTHSLVCFLLGCTLLGGLYGCQSSDDAQLPDSGTANLGEYGDLIAPLIKCMNLPRPADAYNYPFYPGMASWATLPGSTEEKVKACQVPLSVVQNQSTLALIWDLWEFPFFGEPLVTSSSMRQAQAMAHSMPDLRLNAYLELVDRKDNTACLTTCYQAMNPAADPLFYIYAFEAFLTADDLLPQLTDAQRKKIIEAARIKDSLRQADPNRSGSLRAVSWYLIGKLLQTAPYGPFLKEIAGNERLASFLETSSSAEATPALIQTIGNYADAFVNEN